MRVAAVVLAAGRSSRMGLPKLVLPWRGRPILQHVLDAVLAAGAGPVLLVTGPDTPPLEGRAGVEVVFHPEARRGMGGSIAAGVRAVDGRADAVLVCLGDQPGIAPETIATLFPALSGPCRAARPVYRGGVAGHPVLFAAALFPELCALQGEEGARGLLPRANLAAVSVPLPAPPDLDTPEDYARLCAEDPPTGGARP